MKSLGDINIFISFKIPPTHTPYCCQTIMPFQTKCKIINLMKKKLKRWSYPLLQEVISNMFGINIGQDYWNKQRMMIV